MRLVLFPFAILVLILNTASMAVAQQSVRSYLEDLDALYQARQYSDLYERMSETSIDDLDEENALVGDIERFYFETAGKFAKLAERAFGQENNTEICLTKASETWKNYFMWFNNLTSTKKRYVSSKRLRLATRDIGFTLLRLNKYDELFESYAEICNPRYFGPQSMNIWSTALHRFNNLPDNVPLREEIIRDPNCAGYWCDYAKKFTQWKRQYPDPISQENQKMEDVRAIDSALGGCL